MANLKQARFFILMLAFILVCPMNLCAQPAEKIFPRDTRFLITVTNFRQLETAWKRTELGKLLADPVMQPFREHLQQQIDSKRWGLKTRLGITFEEVRSIPTGEVSVGIIELGEEQFALVFVADVRGKVRDAEALVAKAAERLQVDGAKRAKIQIASVTADEFTFPVTDTPRPRRPAICCLHQGLVILADDRRAAELVLANLAEPKATLGEVESYQAIVARLQADAGAETPHVRWYLEPLDYLEALRSWRSQEAAPRADPVARLRAAGFDSIRAIGGWINVGGDMHQIFHRTMVYAPGPLQKSAKMLSFERWSDFVPEPWIPRDVASYTKISVNLVEAFDNIGPLFDQFVGEGEEGVWADVLDSLKNDEDGPQIDLREELVKHLGSRISVTRDYEEPIGAKSERLLFAIEARNPQQVAAALRKTLENDKEIQRRQFGELVIWETIPPKEPPVRSVRLELPKLPGRPVDDAGEEETEEYSPLLPNAAMTVAHGHLLIASHYDFLVKLLRPGESRQSLSKSIDWLGVNAALTQGGAKDDFVRVFYRADEAYRPTYELLRQGKLPESESLLARFLNTLLAEETQEGVRKQRIDGSKLPEFEFVRRHLGPVGMFGQVETQGWFFKGFMLPPARR